MDSEGDNKEEEKRAVKANGKVGIGFSVGAILKWESDPIETIEQARDKPDWFQAIITSAVQLERFGYFAIGNKIESYLKEENKTEDGLSLIYDSLDYLYLLKIGELLLQTEIISSEDNEVIVKLNGVRNSFVHQRYKKKFLSGKEAEVKYKNLVNDAIAILKKLGAETKRLP
jgi:hypothetical protein